MEDDLWFSQAAVESHQHALTKACPRNDDRYKTMISQRSTVAALIRHIYLETALSMLDWFERHVPDLSP